MLLLVDEPDSHLHPTAQERLVAVLARAAEARGTQVLLTTHSPSVVRALPSVARVIWMKNGRVQPDGDSKGRSLMGWGLLDRRILLISEDTRVDGLRALLGQWPDLDRATAIWPVHGASKLPDAQGVSSLAALTGDSLRFVLHRDRDFMMPTDVAELSNPYAARGHVLWTTRSSDLEAYWAEASVIAAHFGVDVAEATELLRGGIARCRGAQDVRRRKQQEWTTRIPGHREGRLPRAGDGELEEEAARHGAQHVILGKTLIKAIRAEAQEQGLPNAGAFGKSVPGGLGAPLAPDLEALLRAQLADPAA